MSEFAGAVFGPWCVTWHIPNEHDPPLRQLAGAVIAAWQPIWENWYTVASEPAIWKQKEVLS